MLVLVLQGEAGVRAEFARLDRDSSGFITKEEMSAVIADSDQFIGDNSLVS